MTALSTGGLTSGVSSPGGGLRRIGSAALAPAQPDLRQDQLLPGLPGPPGRVATSAFVVSPFVQAAYFSLTNWSGFSPEMKFVGLANYVKLLRRRHVPEGRRQQRHRWRSCCPIVTLGVALIFAIAGHGGRLRAAAPSAGCATPASIG